MACIPRRLPVVDPGASRDRASIAVRLILAIPHLIVLCVLLIAWFVITVIAWFVILFTGSYPQSLLPFALGVMRWTLRVEAYLLLPGRRVPSVHVGVNHDPPRGSRSPPNLFFPTMVRRTVALLVLVSVVEVTGQRPSPPSVSMDADDIGGVVASAAGPEAGVWVIAETSDLPTRFAKVVVTDEQGRFLVPDLPRATYDLWVRGYGLVDSSRVRSMPGRTVNLTALAAPSASAAAVYYPALYWFSMLRVPARQEFPVGKVTSQGAWLNTVKTGACQSCHALGTKGMRTVSATFRGGQLRRRRGLAVSSPAAPGRSWRATSIGSIPTAHCACSPTGPTASPPASSRRQSRIDRRASSATL